MGLKTEQFVEKVDENLICGICLEVLEDPLQCKDGHNFCERCITRSLKFRPVCPMDNNALQLCSLGRNLAVKNIIENLKVYCQPEAVAVDDKCDWTGKLESLAKHRETCPFQKVRCPHGLCLVNMLRREFEDHDKICEFKLVQCEKCRKPVQQGDLENHKIIFCDEEAIPCRNRCINPETREVNEIKRRNMEDHLNTVCAKTILECPLKYQGCSVHVERQHVERHVQDNLTTHMRLLAEQCSALSQENQLLKDELNQVKEALSAKAKKK